MRVVAGLVACLGLMTRAAAQDVKTLLKDLLEVQTNYGMPWIYARCPS